MNLLRKAYLGALATLFIGLYMAIDMVRLGYESVVIYMEAWLAFNARESRILLGIFSCVVAGVVGYAIVRKKDEAVI